MFVDIKDIYNFCVNNWNDNIHNEDLLYLFYLQYPGLSIIHNDDFFIGLKINRYKYSDECLLYYTELYDKFKIKHGLLN
jgi:hypothetical protein